jgi:hypothetical protein
MQVCGEGFGEECISMSSVHPIEEVLSGLIEHLHPAFIATSCYVRSAFIRLVATHADISNCVIHL